MFKVFVIRLLLYNNVLCFCYTCNAIFQFSLFLAYVYWQLNIFCVFVIGIQKYSYFQCFCHTSNALLTVAIVLQSFYWDSDILYFNSITRIGVWRKNQWARKKNRSSWIQTWRQNQQMWAQLSFSCDSTLRLRWEDSRTFCQNGFRGACFGLLLLSNPVLLRSRIENNPTW